MGFAGLSFSSSRHAFMASASVLVLVFSAGFAVPSASAADLPEPITLALTQDDMISLAEDYETENYLVEGHAKDRVSWANVICESHYQYQAKLRALVTDVEFILLENGQIDIVAEVRDMDSRGDATYQAKRTLCIPFSGWYGVRVERTLIKARATFDNGGSGLKDMNVRVLSTKLEGLHVGAPKVLQKPVTWGANQTLKVVWRTSMGTWLSKKISSYIKKKFPDQG